MVMMSGGPAVGDNKEKLSVCMPSGFLEDVEPPPQSVADVMRSQYKAAWCKAMKTELDGHKTTGTYEAATPPRGPEPVGAKWVFSYKTDKNGMLAKTKARLVAKGFSQMQDVDYLRLHQLHRQRQLKFWWPLKRKGFNQVQELDYSRLPQLHRQRQLKFWWPLQKSTRSEYFPFRRCASFCSRETRHRDIHETTRWVW